MSSQVNYAYIHLCGIDHLFHYTSPQCELRFLIGKKDIDPMTQLSLDTLLASWHAHRYNLSISSFTASYDKFHISYLYDATILPLKNPIASISYFLNYFFSNIFYIHYIISLINIIIVLYYFIHNNICSITIYIMHCT